MCLWSQTRTVTFYRTTGHWDKTVSSTPDLHLKQKIDNKIAREESRKRYSERQSSPDVVSFLSTSMESSDESQLVISLHKEYTPKRPCVTRRTTLEISKRFVKELGAAADRLNLSSTQLTGIIAAATNHGGGDIDIISLSKSTTNRHRASARKEKAAIIRRNFSC